MYSISLRQVMGELRSPLTTPLLFKDAIIREI
nr:MAG TPA: hypothetical protein [Caudoviricetes sp.]